MKPSQLFEGKNSSLYKTFMNEIKGTYKGKPLEEMTKEELIENSQKDIKSGYLGEEGDDVLVYTTNQTNNRIIEEIQKDLDDGKFYSICSNETTFKNYIFELLKSQREEMIEKIEKLKNNSDCVTFEVFDDIINLIKNN